MPTPEFPKSGKGTPNVPWGPVLHLSVALIRFLERQPKNLLLTAAYAIIVLLGAIDVYTPEDFSFLIFYLLPVFIATFFVGTWAGAIVSVTATAVWFMANMSSMIGSAHLVIPFWNFFEKLGFFLLMTWIMSAFKAALEHGKESARTDPLTALANRRGFREAVGAEIRRSRRSRRPFTFVSMGMDGFKAVNDRLGHNAGDALLCAVADTVRLNIRDIDTPARLGEDEFALLLPETGHDEAQPLLAHLRERLAREMEGKGWPVTFTLCAVTHLSPFDSAEDAIAAADRLMSPEKEALKDTLA